MTATRHARLEAAPGAGELVRLGTTVLFCAERGEGWDLLLAALEAGTGGDPIERLATAVVDGGFSVPPFAAVDWSDRLQLMVLGDLEVRTDHPALPMLSGAASETWVEHTLRGVSDEVAIEVLGDAVVVGTDLVEGRVPAGGFRLHVEVAATVAPAPAADRDDPVTAPAGASPPVASPAVVPPGQGPAVTPQPVVPAPVATPAGATAPVPSTPHPADLPARGAAEPPSVVEPTLAGSTNGDGDLDTSDDLPWLANFDSAMRPGADPDDQEFAAVLAAAVEPDAAVAPATGPATDAEEAPVPELGAPEPEQQNRAQAKVCSHRHANPPTALTCSGCDEWLPPGEEGIEVVALPAIAELVLDDDRRLPLDRPYRFGRRPDGDDGHVVGIMTDGAKVSRDHVEIRGEGWDITVRDLMSTNGTFIAPPGGEPEPLRPDETRTVEVGTIVVFGTRHLEITPAEVTADGA